ncbi:MAG: methyltransferase type 11 [Comamonadaceae bacterium CG_4_9_14_0_8_um_filter_60_18]|nr:MAG: hypothetical protein AUK52_01860 [Comamonadaceae bacterium CG2_30_60_41]PIW09767.1 MAG: methyltransferase type 11 [Comamonadaceae bacterium CG17_big_fil_post_rev_8_21_14_2_50_60_13]PJC19077.1 MAG: methyltransferase type 11 [Comamonadaceae bacterium CG_4_9_14_0_8_um_filter_60_18]
MAKNLRKDLALAQYRLRAKVYDHELAAFEPIRRRTIDCLQLQPGDTVMDIGCGTGLSFELLRQGVGAGGRIIGIEQSSDMIAIAQERVTAHDWRNVTLLQASAEAANSAMLADAALFHFTHDILTSAPAIANVVRQLKPGARLAAAGLQWSQPWDWLTNVLVLAAAMYSMTTLDELDTPWMQLARHTNPITRVPSPMNGTYIVSTTLRADSPPKNG